jgi:hypothetical protein
MHAVANGMVLTYSDALDAKSAQNVNNYVVSSWGLRRTEQYGSPRINEKTLPVKNARLSQDRKTIFLEIPDIQPSWCMEIKLSIASEDGTPVKQQIHNTIHTLK